MKVIFKKAHLPFLKRVLHGGSGRDAWTLARTMQETDGLQHQLPAELFLLQRGAASGDPWSMCELARTYFYHCGDIFLPQALHFWKQAVLQDDGGAKWDLENLPVYQRILAYQSPDGNRYTTIEMQCALLTEWHLTKFGMQPWETLDTAIRRVRCKALVSDVCRVLHIPQVAAEFVPNLHFQNRTVDGLAYWEGKIEVREALFADFERLIEVVFHELGHIVTFEIRKSSDGGKALKDLFGLSDARVSSWERNELGYEVTTSEEDPDTLSYGVYTLWATFFAELT